MSGFQAWALDEAPVHVDIHESPVGPIQLRSWQSALRIDDGSAVVLPTGKATLVWPGVLARLEAGCYAIVPAGTDIMGGGGLVIHTPRYRGLQQLGGPVEPKGRLCYIDGCSDRGRRRGLRPAARRPKARWPPRFDP